MKGRLTTHVLDLSQGRPACGMKVQLWRIGSDAHSFMLAEKRTDADGRLNHPLLDNGQLECSLYEILFFAGDYFREGKSQGISADLEIFLEQVPVRFWVADPDAYYHIPLLVAPGGYSTYRGS